MLKVAHNGNKSQTIETETNKTQPQTYKSHTACA